MKFNDMMGGRGILLLVLIALFSVIGQYLIPQLQNLLSGHVHYFSLRTHEMASVGFWRYSKDVGYLLVAIYSSFLLLKSSSWVRKRWMLFVYAEVAFMALGTLGHISNPGLLYWVAGIRWFITLHCVVSLAMLILLLEEEKRLIPTKAIDVAVITALVLLFVTIVLQALVLNWPMLSGRYRLYSLAPNAGALGYWLVGLGIYFFLSRSGGITKLSLLLIALLVVNLSGSRGPEIVLMVLISFELMIYGLRRKNDSAKKIGIAIWFLSLLIQLPLFSQIAAYTAHRGGLLQTQGMATLWDAYDADSSAEREVVIAEDEKVVYARTRLENIRFFVLAMQDQPLMTTMLGRGLGYGTNTAHLMQPKKTRLHTWVQPIDSAHAAFIAQFGLLGYAAMGFIVFNLIKRVNKRLGRIEDKARFYVLIGVVFLLTLVQNVFENQLLVALCGLGFVFFIKAVAVKNTAVDEKLVVPN